MSSSSGGPEEQRSPKTREAPALWNQKHQPPALPFTSSVVHFFSLPLTEQVGKRQSSSGQAQR